MRIFHFLVGQVASSIVPAGLVTRSTSSAFPLSTAAYPGTATLAQAGVVLGAEGDIIVVTYSQLAVSPTQPTPLSSIVASPSYGLEFAPIPNGVYQDSSWAGGPDDLEMWTATVTAAAAGQTVSISATTTVAPAYNAITVDELTSPLGTNVAWTATSMQNSPNVASTSCQFPAIQAPNNTPPLPLVYYGYCQCQGVTPTGGQSSSSQPFEYSVTSLNNIVAIATGLSANAEYAAVGLTPTAAPSIALATIFTASVSTAPAQAFIIGGTRVNYGNSGTAAETALTGWGFNPTYSVCMEYLNSSATWGTWNTSGVWSAVGGFAGFLAFPGAKVIKVPMQVTGTPLLWTDVTGGGQDSNWTSFFTWCHTNGVQNICPGWEFTGNWYPWGVQGNDTTANQTGFVNTWIHIWNLANAVAPGYFKFWWNPDWMGGENVSPNAYPGGPYYPGDKYVDVIGMDQYNTYSAGANFPGDAEMYTLLTTGPAPNWNQIFAYAQAHGKAICVPECGLVGGGTSSQSNGDDPTWISNTFALAVAAAQAGVTVYYMPWDNTGADPISGYPNAQAELTSLVATAKQTNLVQTSATPLAFNQLGTQSPVSGTPFTVTISATGGTPAYTYTTSGLPTGLTLNASTGVITGTTTETSFDTVVGFTVTDSLGATATMLVTFDVVTGSGLNFTVIPSQSFNTNVPITITMTTTGGLAPYVYSATGLPAGLSISSNTITGTPTQSGEFDIDVSVHDSSTVQLIASQSFNLTIGALPVINSGQNTYGVNTANMTLVFDDEFTGTQLDTTKWLPGWYYNNSPGGGTFGSTATMSQSAIQMMNPGVAITCTGSLSALTAGTINSQPWANEGPWTPGVPSSNVTNPITDFVGFSIAPNGGGVGGLHPGASGPVYVEFSLTGPTASGGGIADWCQSWLAANGPSIPTASLDEIDVMETGPVGYSTIWYDAYGASQRTPAGGTAMAGGVKHTVGVLWTTTQIIMYYDGVAVSGMPFENPYGSGGLTPMGILCSMTDASGNGGGAVFPATCTWHYVRAWQLLAAPTINSIANQTGEVGTAITPYTASASGGTTPYTYSASGLPAGLSINPTTGVVSGTPTTATTYSTTITVTDSTSPTPQTATTPAFSTTISAAAASTLVFNTMATQNETVGTAVSGLTATASGGTTPYTFLGSGLPPGLSIATNGAITGTPTTAGSYTPSLTVDDSSSPQQSKGQNVSFSVVASGSVVPAHTPPAGVGNLLMNATWTGTANVSQGAGPYFSNWPGNDNGGVGEILANLNVVNGQLVLTLSGGTGTGAQVISNSAFPPPFYVEASVTPSVGGPDGQWWGIWTVGPGTWPSGGEFDILENNGQGATSNYHYGAAGSNGGDGYQHGSVQYPNQLASNTKYIVGGVYTATNCTSYLNGAQQVSMTESYIINDAQNIILTAGYYPGQGTAPIYIYFDYVRVWALG